MCRATRKGIVGNWCSAGPRTLHLRLGPTGGKAASAEKKRLQCRPSNWKIIAVLDRQGLGMQSVDANTSEAIAVMMPNDSSVKGSGWKSFRVSVDLVERETGLNFLSNVPSQVQQIIESKVDSQ